MTIQVELSPETEARLAVQAAAHSMDVPTYAATLLEQAAQPRAVESLDHQRPSGRKSLAHLFADLPFAGLNMDFKRDPDLGRDITL